jgi:hypothetical protein
MFQRRGAIFKKYSGFPEDGVVALKPPGIYTLGMIFNRFMRIFWSL